MSREPTFCRYAKIERVRAVLTNSGYVSEDNLGRADTAGLQLPAPLAKDPDWHRAARGTRRLRGEQGNVSRWLPRAGAGRVR